MHGHSLNLMKCSVFRSTPNHTLLTWRCLFKIDKKIRPIYINSTWCCKYQLALVVWATSWNINVSKLLSNSLWETLIINVNIFGKFWQTMYLSPNSKVEYFVEKQDIFFSSFFTQKNLKWMKSPNLILLMHFQNESHTTPKYIYICWLFSSPWLPL